MITLQRPVELDSPDGDQFGPRNGGYHLGVDFGWRYADIPRTRRIYAAADGTIEAIVWNHLVGWTIHIRHSTDVKTRYCHIASGTIQVGVGQRVSAGHYLAQMGNTGTQQKGIHLHFDLYVRNARVNPTPYFARPEDPKEPEDTLYEEDDVYIVIKRNDKNEWTLSDPHAGKDLPRFILGGGTPPRHTEATANGVINTFRGFYVTNDPEVGATWSRTHCRQYANVPQSRAEGDYQRAQAEFSRISWNMFGLAA